MNDKLSFVPEGVADATKNESKKFFKSFLKQIFGGGSEQKQKIEQNKKLAEKAEKSGNTVDEQAKLETVRKRLHHEMIAPPPRQEEPKPQEEDNVGTNEQLQSLGDNPGQDPKALPPLAQPSMRHGERLKIRE